MAPEQFSNMTRDLVLPTQVKKNTFSLLKFIFWGLFRVLNAILNVKESFFGSFFLPYGQPKNVPKITEDAYGFFSVLVCALLALEVCWFNNELID